MLIESNFVVAWRKDPSWCLVKGFIRSAKEGERGGGEGNTRAGEREKEKERARLMESRTFLWSPNCPAAAVTDGSSSRKFK